MKEWVVDERVKMEGMEGKGWRYGGRKGAGGGKGVEWMRKVAVETEISQLHDSMQ